MVKPRHNLRQCDLKSHFFFNLPTMISLASFKLGRLHIKSIILVSLKSWVSWWLQSLHFFLQIMNFSWTAVGPLDTFHQGCPPCLCSWELLPWMVKGMMCSSLFWSPGYSELHWWLSSKFFFFHLALKFTILHAFHFRYDRVFGGCFIQLLC